MPLNPNNPGEYSVMCDACHGRMFIGARVCSKCHGEGRIAIKQIHLTMSQRAAKEAAMIALVVLLIGTVIAGALHWFRVI